MPDPKNTLTEFGDYRARPADQVAESFQAIAAEAARQKLAFIAEYRERLVTAWIAETGLHPSESVLCVQDVVLDGKVTTRMWVERKRETDRVP